MQDDFKRVDLTSLTVAIWGLGLMGGSLALALQGKVSRLIGIDPDTDTLDYALAHHMVDQAAVHGREILAQADVVILAAPVRAILRQLQDLPDLHPGAPVVMDLGSTKQAVTAAMDALPPRFDPLGAHPMSGKEKSSIRAADAALFVDAPFALCPLPRTSSYARAVGEALAAAIGARALWIDPATHDQWVAATSHVPYLVSAALAGATDVTVAPLVGSGFRSTARLAGSNLTMMRDILITNRAAVLPALHAVRQQLDTFEALLAAEDWTALLALFEDAAERQRLLCK